MRVQLADELNFEWSSRLMSQRAVPTSEFGEVTLQQYSMPWPLVNPKKRFSFASLSPAVRVRVEWEWLFGAAGTVAATHTLAPSRSADLPVPSPSSPATPPSPAC